MIRWASHPDLCAHVNGEVLELWSCNEQLQTMQFTMPRGGFGAIRQRYSQDHCLVSDVGRSEDGVPVRIGSCSLRASAVPEVPYSLYCWTYMRPTGNEPALMALQQAESWGIFGCEAAVVFSTLQGVVNGVATIGLGEDTTRKCFWGNSSYLCNTDIFILAWQKLLEMERYKDYNWVVKVDPDAAFFPAILKQHLKIVGDGKAVFLQNWDFPRMLGSIEVISTPAVDIFARMHDLCYSRLIKEGTSEDGFFSDCFAEVLQVPAHVDFALLSNSNHGGCNNGAACYHSFKEPDALRTCYNRALRR